MIIRQVSGRKIKLNHSNQLPKYIIAFDSETIREQTDATGRHFDHKFRLGVAIVGRLVKGEEESKQTYQIHSPLEFWALVHSITGPQHTTWIICHNALFDMVVCDFADQFERAQLVIDWPRSKRTKEDNNDSNLQASGLCIIESPPTIIAARSSTSNGRLVIVDSLNWFPMSLKELGLAAKLPKYAMPAFSDNDEKWFAHCYRDAEIVYATFIELLQWVRRNDFGMFRYTAPAQAMAAYRHRFMKVPIYCHDNMEVKELERQSYFGGRTEVFRMGEIKENVYQLDINSLFPDVMSRGLFPCLLDRYEIRNHFDRPPDNINWQAAIAEVHLKTTHGIFPVRMEKRVVYPIGEFITTLAGEELAFAARAGMIKAIKSWSEYKLADLFSLWVESLWKLRSEYKATGNTLYDQFTKRLMNSLYGKFGQLSPKWININDSLAALPWTNWSELDQSTGERTQFRSFGWQIQKQAPKGEIEGNFVAISSFVTAAARMRMNNLRGIAGPDKVYYQGVDGLIVTYDGYTRLLCAGECSNMEIGKLRHQLTVNHGEIYGCSDYRLGDKVVLSGRANHTESDECGELLQHTFAAQKNMFNGRPINTIEEDITTWQRQGTYCKGVVGPDGWVNPLSLSLTKPLEMETSNAND